MDIVHLINENIELHYKTDQLEERVAKLELALAMFEGRW